MLHRGIKFVKIDQWDSLLWNSHLTGTPHLDLDLQQPENVRNLRMFDGLVVQLEHPSTTKFMKCPSYYGGELWNDLPADIRNTKDIDEFKNTVKHNL